MANDYSAVRIAEDDLRTHVDEFIDEEQAAFEHLLMEKHAASGLGGYHDEYREKVGCQSGPGGICQGHDGTVDK